MIVDHPRACGTADICQNSDKSSIGSPSRMWDRSPSKMHPHIFSIIDYLICSGMIHPVRFYPGLNHFYVPLLR